VNDQLEYNNGQRDLADSVGWAPFAWPFGFQRTGTYTTAQSLVANGGSVALPVQVPTHMLLQSVTLRNTDTATARTAEWRLYKQQLNNGNAGENTLGEVAGANGTWSFTPSVASNQTSTPAAPPIYLAPGVYWLVIRNTNASQTLGLGTQSAGTMALNTGQTKTLGSALGATLDFVAATWTKVSYTVGVQLNGRVFGQTAAF